MSPFWKKRIWDKRHALSKVTFARGYSDITKIYTVTKVDVGPCPIPGWEGDFYRIHFK